MKEKVYHFFTQALSTMSRVILSEIIIVIVSLVWVLFIWKVFFKPERLHLKIIKNKYSVVFNRACFNSNLSKYTQYIYIYIYIYIYTCVCVCVCVCAYEYVCIYIYIYDDGVSRPYWRMRAQQLGLKYEQLDFHQHEWIVYCGKGLFGTSYFSWINWQKKKGALICHRFFCCLENNCILFCQISLTSIWLITSREKARR